MLIFNFFLSYFIIIEFLFYCYYFSLQVDKSRIADGSDKLAIEDGPLFDNLMDVCLHFPFVCSFFFCFSVCSCFIMFYSFTFGVVVFYFECFLVSFTHLVWYIFVILIKILSFLLLLFLNITYKWGHSNHQRWWRTTTTRWMVSCAS